MERFLETEETVLRTFLRKARVPAPAPPATPAASHAAVTPIVQRPPFVGDIVRHVKGREIEVLRTLDLTGALLARGVATLPRGMMYLSAAHDEPDIELTLSALTEAIETIR